MSKNNSRVHRCAKEKAEFILYCLRSSQSVSRCCKESGIAVSLYYSWLNSLISGGTNALERKVGSGKLEALEKFKNHDTELLLLKLRFFEFRLREANIKGHFSTREKMYIVKLVSSANAPKNQILKTINVSSSNYYRRRKNLFLYGTARKLKNGQPYIKIKDQDKVKQTVFKVLHSPPSKYGFNRTTWVYLELQKAIESKNIKIGQHNIRKIIRDAGYRWLRAKKVLTSNDPDYREKLDKIHDVLQNLKENEVFFSIDEYGPFAIKHRQGRKLVPPGQILTVEQWQNPKAS
jgi:hypothetical protein